MGESGVNRQQQMLFQHSLNDIFRRTNHIKILMSFFYFRQHDLVDVECLIDDAYIFTCLFFIVRLEIFEYTFSYIICPVIDLKNSLPWFAGIVATAQKTSQHQQKQVNSNYSFHFIYVAVHVHDSFFFVFPAR